MGKNHGLRLLTLVCLWALLATPASAKTTLRVVGHWVPAQVELFMKNANKYTELHPDIEFQFIQVQTNQYAGISKLLLMMGGEETNPDLIHAYTAITPEMLAGDMLAPVPQDIAQKMPRFFIPQLMAGLTYKGKIYGMPTENQTYVLAYNERAFNESGIAKAPTNWDELARYAKKLTRTSGDGKVERNGFTLGGTFQEFTHELLTLIWGNGGEYIDNTGKVRLNSAPVAETVTYLAELMQAGNGLVGLPTGMATDKNAMAFMPIYRRNGLKNSADYPNMRTVLVPTNKGKPVSYQYGWGFYVSKQSRNTEEAWKFLQWLTMERNEAGRTPMSEHMISMGSLPTNMSDYTKYEEFRKDPFYAGFIQSLDVARTDPLIPGITERQQAIQQAIQPVLAGTAPFSGVLEQLEQRIDTLLQDTKK